MAPNMSSDDISREIGDIIGPIADTITLQSTHRATVLLLTGANGRVVVKRSYVGRQGTGPEHEYATLMALGSVRERVPVPRPIGLFATEQFRYRVLEYLPGPSLGTRLTHGPRQDEPSVVADLARAVRAIHSVEERTTDGNVLLDHQLEVAAENLRRDLLDPGDFTDRTPAQVLAWLRTNRPSQFPACRNHGDLRPKNILYADGRVNGVIDWEHSLVCSPWYDIAVLWYYLTAAEKAVFMTTYGVETVDEDALAYCNELSKLLNV
jgi:aminoglycoside phosphotransferase (APT) family kinase protein